MSVRILGVYDLTQFPNTFDFLTFLQGFYMFCDEFPNKRVGLRIHASSFREAVGDAERGLDRSYQVGKFLTVLAPLATAVKFVHNVTFSYGSASDIEPYDILYPAECFPGKPFYYSYSTRVVMDMYDQGRIKKLYPDGMRRVNRSIVAQHPYFTLSLRTAANNQTRNSNLEFWNQVYRRLSEKIDVYVIPDFDDLCGAREYLKYEWRIVEAAAGNLFLREALYKGSLLNTGWMGGHTSVLDYSDYRFLKFGIYVPGVSVSDKDFFARKGPDFGLQPNFLTEEQFFDWTPAGDLTISYVVDRIRQFVGI